MYHLVAKNFVTEAGLSLVNYTEIFRVERFQIAMKNSLFVGFVCAVLGMVMGPPLRGW